MEKDRCQNPIGKKYCKQQAGLTYLDKRICWDCYEKLCKKQDEEYKNGKSR